MVELGGGDAVFLIFSGGVTSLSSKSSKLVLVLSLTALVLLGEGTVPTNFFAWQVGCCNKNTFRVGWSDSPICQTKATGSR